MEFDDENEKDLDFERPPTPPLASSNVYAHQAKDETNIEEENWQLGTDSKWKAFQNIRMHKRKFWMQQKELQ